MIGYTGFAFPLIVACSFFVLTQRKNQRKVKAAVIAPRTQPGPEKHNPSFVVIILLGAKPFRRAVLNVLPALYAAMLFLQHIVYRATAGEGAAVAPLCLP